MMPYTALADEVISRFGEYLDGVPQVSLDALTLHFQNGLVVQARFATPEEYSILWRYGEAEWRIDTAPRHPHLASFPNHRHDPDESVHADDLTRPGGSPQENLAAVLTALLQDCSKLENKNPYG
jgi:hypothetical protein